MQLCIEYGTQVRVASGVAEEQIQVDDGVSLTQTLMHLRSVHKPHLDSWLSEGGLPRPGLLVFVNDQSPHDYQAHLLRDADRIALMTLVSGG